VEPVSWHSVFGDDRPVEVEIGPGRGDVLLAFGRAHPERGFFGIERNAVFADRILDRVRDAGLENIQAVGGDARAIISELVPADSVAAYHLYFPDPWPKRRHFPRRMLHGDFAATLLRTLQPNGLLYLATDLPELLDYMDQAVVRCGFVSAPDAPVRARPQTRFERRYAHQGTFASVWRRPPG
jgi:tRNA (guanine-N7-)-methyltransferase